MSHYVGVSFFMLASWALALRRASTISVVCLSFFSSFPGGVLLDAAVADFLGGSLAGDVSEDFFSSFGNGTGMVEPGSRSLSMSYSPSSASCVSS